MCPLFLPEVEKAKEPTISWYIYILFTQLFILLAYFSKIEDIDSLTIFSHMRSQNHTYTNKYIYAYVLWNQRLIRGGHFIDAKEDEEQMMREWRRPMAGSQNDRWGSMAGMRMRRCRESKKFKV